MNRRSFYTQRPCSVRLWLRCPLRWLRRCAVRSTKLQDQSAIRKPRRIEKATAAAMACNGAIGGRFWHKRC